MSEPNADRPVCPTGRDLFPACGDVPHSRRLGAGLLELVDMRSEVIGVRSGAPDSACGCRSGVVTFSLTVAAVLGSPCALQRAQRVCTGAVSKIDAVVGACCCSARSQRRDLLTVQSARAGGQSGRYDGDVVERHAGRAATRSLRRGGGGRTPATRRGVRPGPRPRACPAFDLPVRPLRVGLTAVAGALVDVPDGHVPGRGGWPRRRARSRRSTRPRRPVLAQSRLQRITVRSAGTQVRSRVSASITTVGVALPPAQSEVVDADHTGHLPGGGAFREMFVP